ncbi:hypothetical protein [Hansschlegelia plantiphila]|uniref:Uncharacterized protein n=1 Tax=Hansschlegelia plantiphila TaxID=374655 RepID=A0A9W6J0Q3_9HYPH|nr:hypothetical protein [Hansschlegelia plantiphila]GLK67294.1 hypothetical protein GCM10008179_09320 [Hansschlegelia plantiphila]
MSTPRRIRRLQHWVLISAAASLAAVGSGHADDVFWTEAGLTHPQPAHGFLDQDAWRPISSVAPPAEMTFGRIVTAANPDADAVSAGVRADMDRLATPQSDSDASVAGAGPIDARVALAFARFRGAGDEPLSSYAANGPSRPSDVASSARRWTPAVSSALLAFAFPAR